MIVQSLTAVGGDTTVTIGEALYDASGNLHCYLLDEAEVNPAKPETVSISLPQVNGGVVIGGSYGVRDVSVSGEIHAPTRAQLLQMRDTLVRVFSDHNGDPITLNYTVDQDRSISAFVTDGPDFTAISENTASFTVALACPDPVSYSTVQQTADAGLTTPGQSVTVGGSASIYPQVVVTAATATVTGVRVGSTTAAAFVQIDNITLPADGTELTIDFTPGQELVSLGGIPIMDKLNTSSEFFQLAPGTNQLYVTDLTGGGAAEARATFLYSAGWLS